MHVVVRNVCGPHGSTDVLGVQACAVCARGRHARVRAQLYGCNVLNLGNSRIISVHAHTARQIVRDKHFRGDVQIIDFTPITSMYGAVHCSSQARPRSLTRPMCRRD